MNSFGRFVRVHTPLAHVESAQSLELTMQEIAIIQAEDAARIEAENAALVAELDDNESQASTQPMVNEPEDVPAPSRRRPSSSSEDLDDRPLRRRRLAEEFNEEFGSVVFDSGDDDAVAVAVVIPDLSRHVVLRPAAHPVDPQEMAELALPSATSLLREVIDPDEPPPLVEASQPAYVADRASLFSARRRPRFTARRGRGRGGPNTRSFPRNNNTL